MGQIYKKNQYKRILPLFFDILFGILHKIKDTPLLN